MKRVFCVLFVLALLLVTAVSASAVDYGCNVVTVSKSIYLENLDTGAVILDKYSGKQMFPASLTKIMTYVVTAENVQDIENTYVEIKESDMTGLDPESTLMGLPDHVGESFSVKDLLYGLMLPSGNDAALVLANYVGNGDISSFVDKMNAKAAELGCADTHFANPHGLHDPNHYTTALDMAKIVKHAMNLPLFMEITSTVYYTPEGFESPLHNTNYMLDENYHRGEYYYPNVKGVKTGFTDEAGKCLVTTAGKDGFTYLCVAMGADYSYEDDINYAMKDSANLYDWVFENIAQQVVFGTTDMVKSVPVKYASKGQEIALVPEKDVVALLPKDYDKSLLNTVASSVEEVEAPVKKGDVLGSVSVSYSDLDLGSVNLTAAEDIERDKFSYITTRVGEFLKNNFIWIIIGGVLLIVLIIVISAARSSAAKKKRERERRRARRRYRE